MMTVGKLFRRRLREEWAFQWSVWRLAVDWIIALYVVIPVLAFAGYHYMRWWTKTPPDWFAFIPYAAIAVVLYIWSRIGTIRYFVQEADQLVLLHTRWIRELMMRGVWYSLVFQAVTAGAVVSVVLPLLRREYGFSWLDTAVLVVFLVSFKMTASLLRQAVSIRYAGFQRWLISFLLFAVEVVFFIGVMMTEQHVVGVTACACAVLIALSPALVRRRLLRKGAFAYDVERERSERMKYAALMLGRFVAKKARIARKRPLLFRSSNRLFRSRTQVNGLAELSIKSFFRSKANVKTYIQLTLISCGGIVALPVAAKWILWFGSGLLLCYYTRLYVRDAGEEPFLKLFRWQDTAKWEARKKSVFLITLPAFALLGVVLGASAYSWLGALGLAPVSAAACFVFAETIGSWGK